MTGVPKHYGWTAILIVFLTVGFALHVYIRNLADKPGVAVREREELLKTAMVVQGAVVYQRESDRFRESIYKTIIGNPKAIRLARNGHYPRWSPDGRYVVFLRSNQVMRMTSWGFQPEVLATTEHAGAVAYHPNGREVLFTDTDCIKSIDLATRRIRAVVSNDVFVGLDISADGTRLVAAAKNHRVVAFDLAAGTERLLDSGCSVSLSPDGKQILHNTGRHVRLTIQDWETGEKRGAIPSPDGHQIDNTCWSNDPDWVASRTEEAHAQNVYIHQISMGTNCRVTFTDDCNRPDLFVRHGKPGLFDRFMEWSFLL